MGSSWACWETDWVWNCPHLLSIGHLEKLLKHFGPPIYHVRVGIINNHITEFWTLSKIIPFMLFYSPCDLSYPLQLFFYKNMQIFILFKHIILIITLSCLNSFSDCRMKPELHIRTFQITHDLTLVHLLTSCCLATTYSPVLLDVDIALKFLNAPQHE